VERPGRTIVWVGMPTATAKNLEKARPAMNRAAQAELARRPGTLFLDTVEVLSGGDGRYKDFLTVDGEAKRVRGPDGFHLSPAGASLLGRSLERLIGTVWPVGDDVPVTSSTGAPTGAGTAAAP